MKTTIELNPVQVEQATFNVTSKEEIKRIQREKRDLAREENKHFRACYKANLLSVSAQISAIKKAYNMGEYKELTSIYGDNIKSLQASHLLRAKVDDCFVYFTATRHNPNKPSVDGILLVTIFGKQYDFAVCKETATSVFRSLISRERIVRDIQQDMPYATAVAEVKKAVQTAVSEALSGI